MNYVIGDVHGCYDELQIMLRQIEEDDDNAIIYFVGEFIDRGPKVWETLSWAMGHITPEGKYRAVRGNHEQMVVEWFLQWKQWKKVGNVGGFYLTEPATRYDFYSLMWEKDMLREECLEPIVAFFRSLPLNCLVTVTNSDGQNVNYRIAHAWHYYEQGLYGDLKQNINLWDRGHISKPIEEIVVHGHTPTIARMANGLKYPHPGRVNYEAEGGINVDGGCCYHSESPDLPVALCGICLETGKEYYVSPKDDGLV